MANTTGKIDPRLIPPPIPPSFAHVLDWYEDLANGRVYTMAGPQAISYQEIESWSRLKYVQPNPNEVALLRELDISFLNTYHKIHSTETK